MDLFPDNPPRPGPANTEHPSLTGLVEDAKDCRRCPLHRLAAPGPVSGEGPAHAPVMLVGEQPGDQEYLQGRPFVEPAGKMLDRALADAGIGRRRVCATNAVRHFKFELRGRKRLHKKPNAGEIEACRWWLDQELDREYRRIVRDLRLIARHVPAAKLAA